jgi:hypothetical protein
MWLSEDGRSWDLVPEIQDAPDELWIDALAWHGNGLVLYGSAIENGVRVNVLGRWTLP